MSCPNPMNKQALDLIASKLEDRKIPVKNMSSLEKHVQVYQGSLTEEEREEADREISIPQAWKEIFSYLNPYILARKSAKAISGYIRKGAEKTAFLVTKALLKARPHGIDEEDP